MSVRPLSPELAEKAQKELFEDPKRLNEDLQNVKDWIAKQPHLRARTDDQWLLAFLRGCKFSLERTKEKIDLYYSCRTHLPEYNKLKHTDPLFKEILELGSYLVLPDKGCDHLVTFIRPGTYNSDKYNIIDIMAVNTIIQKIILMENDNATIGGTQTVVDLEAVNFGHFLQMTPAFIKKSVVATQDALPFRIKGVHYLNTPPGIEKVFNAIKILLNKKNQQRLYIHNKNYEAMYEHIPKNILPAEYGGNGGTIQEIIDYWKKKIEEWGPWLEEDAKLYGTDESKRPGKPKTSEDMFGVEGSFRKLELD